jgi:hypothetical protein
LHRFVQEVLISGSSLARPNCMEDPEVSRGGGKLLPLRPTTIDDGVVRLGPARLEPLAAAEEAQAIELLAFLFAAALRRQRASTRLKRAA